MSLWEYKVITSGKGGFARPDLMEKFLNDLGRDEWEIIQFHAHPDNFLAFTGLARRSTQRDWTLQDAAAAAAKVEADKLRAEFEAKFKAAASNAPAAVVEERAPSFLEEKAAPDDGLRSIVDTSRDDDPEAHDDDKSDDWDKLTAAEEEELPSFFDAIKPHMRRNQRGPGMSVGVDYLAKKWDQTEEDLRGALVECGFVMPADEDSKTEYVEYDGDLYWLNINRRGELWINTKEKPRPIFRSVKAARIEIETPAPRVDAPAAAAAEAKPAESAGDAVNPTPEGTEAAPAAPKPEPSEPRHQRSEAPAASLPSGASLLNKIRPHMRRNRRGPGGSGSTSFLARALRTNEASLKEAFVALGLTMPATPGDKPVFTEIGHDLWWLNLDSRGGLWINGREKRDGETLASANAEAVATPESAPATTTSDAAPATAPATDAAATPESATPPETISSAALETAPIVAAEATPAVSPETTPVVAPEPTPAPAPAPAAEVPAETVVAPVAPAPEAERPAEPSQPTPSDNPVLTAVRLLLKETKTGSVAASVERLAADLGKSESDLLASLIGAGLKVPEKSREKPAFVEHAGEILWLNKNAKDELWLNAKASKFSDKDDGDYDKKSGRRNSGPRTKKPE